MEYIKLPKCRECGCNEFDEDFCCLCCKEKNQELKKIMN